jgi:predicted LPLAT superfamily acyltransferase
MDLADHEARAGASARNPGPSWGYAFLARCDRWLPEAVFRPLRALGTLIALAFMPAQRRHSREYLAVVFGRRPTFGQIFRHFFAFEEAYMDKLRLANGREIPCEYDPSAAAFAAWLAGGGPILLGTFHVGASDMLGFQIGSHEKRRVHLLRRRVDNSQDTTRLAETAGGAVRFIWANDPAEMIFALKSAADSGEAIAMQCDRIEQARQTHAFDFLGARRRFPTTIYRLALVLGRDVILTVGVPVAPDRSRLYGSPRFAVVPGESRSQALDRAHAHFQAFLRTVEQLLRERPYLWFNFLPLNPLVESAAPTAPDR